MKFITPLKSLNKTYLKMPVSGNDISKFGNAFKTMNSQIKDGESEEYFKNLINDFLKNSFYSPDYMVNTSERYDSVIYNGNKSDAKPAVIIEVKSPTNKTEMFNREKLNAKACYEILLYFLREDFTNGNREIKKLVITNFEEWYVFDAKDFADHFGKNKKLLNEYEKFVSGQMTDSNTTTFYNDIAPNYVHDFFDNPSVNCICFTNTDIQSAVENYSQNDTNAQKKLVAFYKFFSPENLLNKPFANDSNTLDKGFYEELLYIIGLEEITEGNKKLIVRCSPQNRFDGSLIESAIYQLEEKYSSEEICFEAALRLSIVWVNRLLFLKLLESTQLVYQSGNPDYKFLTSEFIPDYDILNELFFKVLAKRPEERNSSIKEKYKFVPYLNSSLFEVSEEEENTGLQIRGLKSCLMPVFKRTVLKKDGRRSTEELDTLEYIFRFLDSYNFASDGSQQVQEENKTLINASVLGLIFEKINGYKDGSFFTPGYITQYMAHEALERAVVEKFNNVKKWKCKNLIDVKNEIEDRAEAERIFDSIHICDPAVGSGHFLVSCLNEMVALKSYLGILFAPDGSRIKPNEWEITVDNDEISVTDESGSLYTYNHKIEANRIVQEALFYQKKKIIENCLFGVDINPNSVAICRLRLWIELLKNAYYTKESGFMMLETLPNIDINIKCGNSLVSKYGAEVGKSITETKAYKDGGTQTDLKKLVNEYKKLVADYKSESEKTTKADVKSQIAKIKSKVYGTVQLSLFEEENEEIRKNDIFRNSLEWMFEFPEVLDENGKFTGFDVVIGNPPYGLFNKKQNQKVGLETGGESFEHIKKSYPEANEGMINAAKVFYVLGLQLLKTDGLVCMIIPFGILSDSSSIKLRKFLFEKNTLIKIDAFPERDAVNRRVFEEAKMSTAIILTEKGYSDIKFDIGVSYNKEISANRAFFSYSEIKDFSPEYLSIPMCTNNVFSLLQKLRKNPHLSSVCNAIEGEVHMTKGKPSLTMNPKDYKLFKGVQLDRWIYKTSKADISQGEIEFVKFDVIKNICSTEKLENIKSDRIAYQRLTGINEKHRLKAVIIPANCFIANSACCLKNQGIYSDKFILGLFNSTLLNFVFKATSTSSNVNGYEIDALPIPSATPEQQKPVIELVDEILSAKKENPSADTSDLEKEIDKIVYQLYGLTREEIDVVEGK